MTWTTNLEYVPTGQVDSKRCDNVSTDARKASNVGTIKALAVGTMIARIVTGKAFCAIHFE